jgi:hypothetical protein
MIPVSAIFDQSTLHLLLDYDPVVQRYRAFFALFDWSQLPEREDTRLWPARVLILARLTSRRSW